MQANVILTGQVLSFNARPDRDAPGEAARIDEAIALDGGRIAALGTRADLVASCPAARVEDKGQRIIMAGFVDAHAHYPQTAMIASWGKQLIDWLNTYTFPEEIRFQDRAYAEKIAARYLDLTAACGTTTLCTYCTIHPGSVEAIFAEAKRRSQRLVAGKTCMDRETAPAALRDSAQSAYDDSKALIARWHGVDRLSYAITPRFSPTSTPQQLSALGALWQEHPDCLMQTHLSEQRDEIKWVQSLYPEARDYLDTYEAHGLLGARGLYGHAIHLTAREEARLAETGAALVHCPTSNTFIGSGLFDLRRQQSLGNRIALATDTGGGSSFSMLRTMAATYEIAQLRGHALHPAELLWYATAGGAAALHMEDSIGNLKPGLDADLIVLDPDTIPALAQRAAAANSLWELLFAIIMLGDDRSVAETWINGRLQPS